MLRVSVPHSIDIVYSLVGGSDYREISAEVSEVVLIFNNENRQQSFTVEIINDSFFEMDVENFTLELMLRLEDPPSNLKLHPNVSTVEILDDDGMI